VRTCCYDQSAYGQVAAAADIENWGHEQLESGGLAHYIEIWGHVFPASDDAAANTCTLTIFVHYFLR